MESKFLCYLLSTWVSRERDVVQAVSFRQPTAEACVQSWDSSLRFLENTVTTEQGFPEHIGFPPSVSVDIQYITHSSSFSFYSYQKEEKAKLVPKSDSIVQKIIFFLLFQVL